MNPATGLPGPSYDEALATAAALFLDILKGAHADREKAVIAQIRSVPRPKALGRQLRELMRGRGPLTPREMRAIVGCSSMTLTRALRTLVAEGHVESRGSTRSLTYQLVQQPYEHSHEPEVGCDAEPLFGRRAPTDQPHNDQGQKAACYDAENISTSKRIDPASESITCDSEVSSNNQ